MFIITKLKNMDGYRRSCFWQTRTSFQDAKGIWRHSGGWRHDMADATKYPTHDEAVGVNAINSLEGNVVLLTGSPHS